MNENVVDPIVPPAAAAAPAPAVGGGVDQAAYEAELNRLRAENLAYQETYQRLQPYVEDINWLTQDQQNAEFLRRSRKAYEQARRDESQVPAELKPLYDKVEKIDRFVDTIEAQQKQAAEEPKRRWYEQAKAFCNDLMVKYPQELSRNADPSLGWASALEAYCMQRGLAPEEGWKVIGPAFVKPSSAPPPSMRADAGMPGLPPPSRQPAPATEAGKKLGQIVLERMHAMSGTS